MAVLKAWVRCVLLLLKICRMAIRDGVGCCTRESKGLGSVRKQYHGFELRSFHMSDGDRRLHIVI